MRILRVAQTYYPDVTGGGAYHVHAMSRDQASMGHDVTVLTLRRDDDAPRRASRNGYTVLRRDPTASVLGNELSVGLARELWGADGFDVVHAHSHLYFATNAAALKRRFGDTPLAITNHGLYSQSAPRWLFDLYLRTLGRATFESADVVFCYSEADELRLRDLGVTSDVAVVRNGIDTARFTPDGPAGDLLPHGDTTDPTVLFVGRLVSGKRPADAVAAMERVVTERPDARLILVGDGPERTALEGRVAATGLSDRVTFLGHVAYDEMPALYRAVDLLVLPSEGEGVPRTVLESLATGTPAVASDLSQLDALLEAGGRGVPVGDVDALAAAISDLLGDDSLRARLGDTGRRLVVEQYTWTETVERTTDRLAALAQTGKSGPNAET